MRSDRSERSETGFAGRSAPGGRTPARPEGKKPLPGFWSSEEKKGAPLAFCLGILLIALLIQAAGWLKGDSLVFPPVGEILRAFLRLLGKAETWAMIGTTLRHLLLSMAVSVTLGTALGLLQGRSPFLRGMLRPLMTFLRSLPMLVLVIIVMVLTPYRRVPVLASSLILTPMVAEATCEGFLRIEPELLDVYRLNSGFTLQVLLRVYLPLMAGYLKQAWINAVGMGLKLAVSTEYLVQTRDSLGKAIYTSSYFGDYQDIYAYALIMILLVLLVSELPLRLLRMKRGGGGPD